MYIEAKQKSPPYTRWLIRFTIRISLFASDAVPFTAGCKWRFATTAFVAASITPTLIRDTCGLDGLAAVGTGIHADRGVRPARHGCIGVQMTFAVFSRSVPPVERVDVRLRGSPFSR